MTDSPNNYPIDGLVIWLMLFAGLTITIYRLAKGKE